MRKGIRRAAVCMIVVIGLVGCGGGGGSSAGGGDPDTMTVIVTGASGTTTAAYTEGPYNNNGFLDPSLSASVAPSSTSISLCTGSTGTTCATLITIFVKGITPQSYPTGTSNTPTQITYRANSKTYSSIYSNTTGTITLASIGNAEEKITGAFDTVVANMTNSSDTLVISGTFSVTRVF